MLVNMNIINFTMNLPKYKQSSVDKLLVQWCTMVVQTLVLRFWPELNI